MPEPEAVTLLRLRPGQRPVRPGPVRQDHSVQPASRARSPGVQDAKLGRHGGPEPSVRGRPQGVRRRCRRQAVLLPPEPGVPAQDRARRRPAHVRQGARSDPTLCHHPDAIQVDRIQRVRHDVQRAFLRPRPPRYLDRGPALPLPVGRQPQV